MMEAVRLYSLKNKLVCDLALETIMACGIGICQGCTVEKKIENLTDHSYRNRFALACLDGPIFKASEIVACG
jgi:dihydroorotate dehydrogenase electron transfer subunit